jgi:addiction module RelE/StbE family toxin
MQIRWSPAAAEDFSHLIEYIRRDNPQAAQRVAKAIYESANSLRDFPYKGRAGRVEGTRELLLPSLPFLLVYRITKDAVEIANVIHGAQKYPPTT